MLFQPSVLKKHLADLDHAKVRMAYDRFCERFADPAKQENIRSAKEEQYQEGFLRDLFVDVLGYTLNPSPGYDLSTEFPPRLVFSPSALPRDTKRKAPLRRAVS